MLPIHSYVLKKRPCDIITVDEFAKRMQFTELYMQYSFHMKRSLGALRFLEVRDVI